MHELRALRPAGVGALAVLLALLLVACEAADGILSPDSGPPAQTSGDGVPAADLSTVDGALARFLLPRFGVDSPIEAIGIDANNVLQVPSDPHNTGWYSIYDKPGTGGNAVFSAHVDYWPDVRGPFYRLFELEPGDQVVVVTADGVELVYEVFFKERYSAAAIPMGDLVWPAHRPVDEEWVTLITCGGRFQPGDDGPGEYLDRDVVIARRIA